MSFKTSEQEVFFFFSLLYNLELKLKSDNVKGFSPLHS